MKPSESQRSDLSTRLRVTLTRAAAVAVVGLATWGTAGCADTPTSGPGSAGEVPGQVTAALSQEQCSYFSVDDKVTLCHAANLKKGKYVLIRVNEAGCVNGHADHDGDFISLDGTCDNDACFPVDAPYDSTIACCDNMTVVDGACACVAGYQTLDGATCSDIDECADDTDGCDANATCTNTPGAFTCACNAGYTGDGVTCADVDECADGTDGCDANATCTNTPGAFTCACNAGYTGDGVTCADIDECADGTDDCDANATCTNLPGAYACACNAGFEGDGTSCADVDGCATTSCDVNATCADVPAPGDGATCTCNAGYEGDGATCTEIIYASCGDGVVNQSTELCDRGALNGVPGSGCNADCTLEVGITLSAKIHEHCDPNSTFIEFTQDTPSLNWPSYLNRPSYVTLGAHTGVIVYQGLNFTGQQLTLTANTNFCYVVYPNGSGVNDQVLSLQLFYAP